MLIRCRYPDWLVAMLLWPILMPTFTVFAVQALAGPDNSGGELFAKLAGTSDYIGFVFIGIVMWTWLNTVLWQVGATLRTEQRRGTLESNWVTPASRLSIMFGSGLTNMLSSLVTVAVSLIFCKMAWSIDLTFNPFLGLIFLLSTAAIYGLGLIFASLVLLVKELNSAVNFVRGMFMVFCGITYPISVMPHWMQSVAKVLPLTYSIRLIREVGLTGAGYKDVSGTFWVLFAFAASLFAGGYILFILMDSFVSRKGTLGQY
ncbi:MAG TPA: ABC transporter permease [Clostridiaceae bacterium]|nr:ABC transporter permease [Clostridiaceae bacterium]